MENDLGGFDLAVEMAPTSPYKKFRNLQAAKTIKRKITSLIKGKQYTVVKYENIASQFKRNDRFPTCLLAYFVDSGMNFFTYLPADFEDTDDDTIKELNADIAKGKPSTICYYGTIGAKNMVRIHEFGGNVEDDLLATCENMVDGISPKKENPESPMKRLYDSDDEDRPKDRPKFRKI